MALERLNVGTPSVGSSIPFYDVVNGQDRRCSVTDLATVISSSLATPGAPITQYSAPAATGFSVTVVPGTDGGDVNLRLTPAAGYAAGTIVLPPVANCHDQQTILVTCTQTVATLTVDGNGATVNGAPTAFTANGFFKLQFDGVFSAWYRVG